MDEIDLSHAVYNESWERFFRMLEAGLSFEVLPDGGIIYFAGGK